MSDGQALTLYDKQENVNGQLPQGEPLRISHAVLLTAAQSVRAVSRVLFVLCVARALGPERFGIYTLLLTLVEILAVVSGIGHGDYLTREAARDVNTGWALGEQLIWLRLAYAIPATAIAIGVLWLIRYPGPILAATLLMSLTLIPRSFSEAAQGVLRGVERYWDYLVLDVVLGVSLLLGAILLLLKKGGISGVIAAELAAALATGITALVIALRLRPRVRAFLKWSSLVRKSIVFNIYPFVTNLYDRIDILMLSKLAGNYATGVYGAAYRPIGAVQLLPYGILYSLLPTLSRSAWRRADMERFERAMGLLLSAAFLIVLMTMIFADSVVPALLGVRFAQSTLALKILIWSVILRYLNYALTIGLLAAGRESVFIVSSSVSLAVNFIGNLILIPLFSWRAAAVLTIVTESFALALNLYWTRKASGTVPRPVGGLRTTIVFFALLGVALAGAKMISPLAMGALCLLLYTAYLYRAGMIAEFAAAWRANRSIAS